MADRRSNERLQVDAHLADLEAGLEAGARALVKLEQDAMRVDRIVATETRQSALMSSLLGQIKVLRKSVQQQRGMLRDLRQELHELRGQPQSGKS